MDLTAPSSVAYSPSTNLPARLRRRLTQWTSAAPLPASPGRAVVSFTFDDCPVTAVDNGSDIVARFGGRACFYIATGLLGQSSASGQICDEGHVYNLYEAGHEIGAHTSRHGDCATMAEQAVLKDIGRNLKQLKTIGVDGPIRQFAYPFGETHLRLKQSLVGRFDGARGILPGLNVKGSDAMQLRAVELTPGEDSLARARRAIESAARKKAWLIFFTHDVSRTPSRFGVSPEILTQLVRQARDSGADIETPSHAMDLIKRAVS